MQTNRRTLLRTLGTVALAGAAGCLSDVSTTPGDGSGETPRSVEFEAHHYRSMDLVVEDGLGPDSVGDRYATVLTGEADVNQFVSGSLDADTTAFVDETDFESHDLLVVQTYLSSISKEFSLDSVERAGADLAVSATVKTPEMGAQAVTYETVLARIPAEDTDPASVSLTVDGQSVGTFDLKAPESVSHESVHLHHTDSLYADSLAVEGDAHEYDVKAFTSADGLSLDGHADAKVFTDETDFSSHTIVAVQTRVGSPCKSLAVQGVERGRRLRVRAAIDEKDATCAQQVQLSTALVRVPVTGLEKGEVSAVVQTADGSERAVLAKR
ncbi:hypothetical protein [Haloarchaeobius sp. TZWWS8]|uniref:hypothetical protein n=1 Tax=Haloarchaeobius sp. TZWWS8 TaxID=3446121 RepID=UPI003EBBC700